MIKNKKESRKTNIIQILKKGTMGCDYYFITQLSVVYTNKCDQEDFMEIEIERDRMYSSAMETDTSTSSEMYKLEKVGRESLVCVYQNQKWTIQNQNRIDGYCEQLAQNNIDMKTVQSIHRRIYCQDR